MCHDVNSGYLEKLRGEWQLTLPLKKKFFVVVCAAKPAEWVQAPWSGDRSHAPFIWPGSWPDHSSPCPLADPLCCRRCLMKFCKPAASQHPPVVCVSLQGPAVSFSGISIATSFNYKTINAYRDWMKWDRALTPNLAWAINAQMLFYSCSTKILNSMREPSEWTSFSLFLPASCSGHASQCEASHFLELS